MSDYIVRIECRLVPSPAIEYPTFTENLPSFSITADKETVVAVPHADKQLDFDTAWKLLQTEIVALLSVFGAEEGRVFRLEVTQTVYRTMVTKVHSAQVRVVYSISGPPITDIAQKVHSASVDPTYRDLLDFYRKAREAFNPRPFGYNMVERLEKRFGDRDSACKALGIKRRELNPIVDDQWKYQDDRHAKFDVGKTPPQITSIERNEIMSLLREIIQKYEQLICARLP